MPNCEQRKLEHVLSYQKIEVWLQTTAVRYMYVRSSQSQIRYNDVILDCTHLP